MTRTRTITLALGGALLAAGLLAGCATPTGTSTSPGGSPSATTAASPNGTAVSGLPGVTITRTGGFAGVNQTLTVSADGAWTYTDKKSGATSTGQFTPAQLAQLAQLALDPRVAQEVTQTSTSVCNDAFHYDLAVGPVKASFEDCGQSRPAVQAMLAYLTDNTPL